MTRTHYHYVEWFRWNPDAAGFCESGAVVPPKARNITRVGLVDSRTWAVGAKERREAA